MGLCILLGGAEGQRTCPSGAAQPGSFSLLGRTRYLQELVSAGSSCLEEAALAGSEEGGKAIWLSCLAGDVLCSHLQQWHLGPHFGLLIFLVSCWPDTFRVLPSEKHQERCAEEDPTEVPSEARQPPLLGHRG